MQWGDYVRLVRRGVALGMVEGRVPGESEPALFTPQWALDAAQRSGSESADVIAASGVTVLGNIDALRSGLSSGEQPVQTDQLPIDAAVQALVSVIESSREDSTSRELAGRLLRQTKKDGIRSLLRKNSE
ncbi:MAG: hypothetical protein K9G12_06650, partial [Candidatus Nanopelagicales bacterium]|nr:hypothetical protein [Candidatus Nanopelagicales bacterium]